VRRFLPAFIGLLSFVVFIPALSGEFLTWDDDINLVSNTFYRGLGSSQIRWAFSNVRMGHYIPLTWLGLSANYAAGGMNPWGYHLVNVILHVANAVTLYFVARRLLAAAGDGGRQDRRADPSLAWGAAVAALVFALHPLRVESVAWITERRDVQSGFFYLLSILTHLRSLEADERAQWHWRAGSLLLFAGGLLSKASIMVLPAVLVLLDVYPLRRGALSWRRLVIEKAGYWVLGAAGAGGALIALRLSGLQITSYGAYGPEARAAMMAYSFWFYPSTWVWPVRLSPMYELPARVHPLAEPFLGAIVGLVVVTALLVLFRRRWPAGLAAWLYSALLILPISGAVHAGFQLAHDRYSYLSGLGFALVAGGAIAWVLTTARARRVGRPVLAAGLGVAALVIVALAVQSWQQLRIWRDSDTLWRWSLEADPRCAVCANNLAALIINRPSPKPAQLAEAESLARRALEQRPTYDSAHNTLGVVFAQRGEDGAAETEFRQAIQLSPDRVASIANLGALYARTGRPEEALPLLRRAWAKEPDYPGLRTSLGFTLRDAGIAQARAGHLPAAVRLLQEAEKEIPDDADVHRNLGLALWEHGQSAAAVPYLERAVTLRPDDENGRRLLTRLRTDPEHPPSFR
jgi:Flp pilus assembly protein TadD